jgi:hypothetical protein
MYRPTKIRRLIAQLGFRGAALLPEHEHTFGALADAIVGGNTHSRPLDEITASELPKVRAVVGRLPPTREVEQFLAATANDPVVHGV